MLDFIRNLKRRTDLMGQSTNAEQEAFGGEGLTQYSRDAIYAALMDRLKNASSRPSEGIENLLEMLRRGKGRREWMPSEPPGGRFDGGY